MRRQGQGINLMLCPFFQSGCKAAVQYFIPAGAYFEI